FRDGLERGDLYRHGRGLYRSGRLSQSRRRHEGARLPRSARIPGDVRAAALLRTAKSQGDRPPAPRSRKADAVPSRQREARPRHRLSMVGRQQRAGATPLRAMAAVVVPKPQYIGKPVKRIEDRALLTGNGRFVADLDIPGTLDAAFVR